MRDIWIKNSLETWTWFGQEIRDLGAVMMLENPMKKKPSGKALNISKESGPGDRKGYAPTGYVIVISNLS